MKAKLIEFLRRQKEPNVATQTWNTQQMPTPAPQVEGSPQLGDAEGPTAGAMDSFAQDIDMPEDAVSSLQGNPSQVAEPVTDPQFGNSFKERLRRRRTADMLVPERGGSYG